MWYLESVNISSWTFLLVLRRCWSEEKGRKMQIPKCRPQRIRLIVYMYCDVNISVIFVDLVLKVYKTLPKLTWLVKR